MALTFLFWIDTEMKAIRLLLLRCYNRRSILSQYCTPPHRLARCRCPPHSHPPILLLREQCWYKGKFKITCIQKYYYSLCWTWLTHGPSVLESKPACCFIFMRIKWYRVSLLHLAHWSSGKPFQPKYRWYLLWLRHLLQQRLPFGCECQYVPSNGSKKCANLDVSTKQLRIIMVIALIG